MYISKKLGALNHEGLFADTLSFACREGALFLKMLYHSQAGLRAVRINIIRQTAARAEDKTPPTIRNRLL